ncbi:MAG: hypothetical protein KAS32_08115 [Candidatus Peribacteraceae bacterium]|nr:hypothetical protein [Candidatus Peribacteraceae bacterium]
MKIKITNIRRDGNTTRQIDIAIQKIFLGQIFVAEDHFEEGNNRRANEDFFIKVINRLKNEHYGLFKLNNLKIDKDKLEISLNNYDG